MDSDTADRNRVTACINQKILDPHGRLLGVIGIGVEAHPLTALLRYLERRYNGAVLFSDAGRRSLLSSIAPASLPIWPPCSTAC